MKVNSVNIYHKTPKGTGFAVRAIAVVEGNDGVADEIELHNWYSGTADIAKEVNALALARIAKNEGDRYMAAVRACCNPFNKDPRFNDKAALVAKAKPIALEVSQDAATSAATSAAMQAEISVL